LGKIDRGKFGFYAVFLQIALHPFFYWIMKWVCLPIAFTADTKGFHFVEHATLPWKECDV
jgi:hypothetical protein